jgi:formate dehydrogenase subunit gamma
VTHTAPVPGPPTNPRTSVLRFDGVQRGAHWATALLFVILIATAIPLYFGSVAVSVGRRELITDVHVWTGIVLPVPVLVSLLGPWGRRMRRDLRRANYWTRSEVNWLFKRTGPEGPVVRDKFNPGQKLNVAFTGGAMVVMLATGSILHWFALFPLGWRSGATLVHDVVALAIVTVLAAHVTFACTHREALRSMFTGRIERSWARRNAPGWLEEVDAAAGDPAPVGPRS